MRKWALLAAAALAAGLASEPGAQPQNQVSEITLERTPCFGACPVDKVTLRADGTALHTGTRFAERLGEYQGLVSTTEYRRLTALLLTQGFFTLPGRYTAPGERPFQQHHERGAERPAQDGNELW
jgi:hypothetical protein